MIQLIAGMELCDPSHASNISVNTHTAVDGLTARRVQLLACVKGLLSGQVVSWFEGEGLVVWRVPPQCCARGPELRQWPVGFVCFSGAKLWRLRLD